MSVTRLGFQNSVLSAQLTAGSQALPVSGLQGQLGSPSTGWQTAAGVTTSVGGAWVRGYTPNTVSRIDCFGVFRTNLSNAASVRCRVFSDAYVTAIYDSGSIPAYVQPGIYQSLTINAAAPVGSYWQMDFDDVSNDDGYINIPLMYVGQLFAPVVGLAQGSVQSLTNSNVSIQTRYGQTYIANYWSSRQYVAAFGGIYDSEMSAFTLCDSVSRDGTNVLFIPNVVTGTPNLDAIFGLCTSTGFGYALAHKDTRSWTPTFVERL